MKVMGAVIIVLMLLLGGVQSHAASVTITVDDARLVELQALMGGAPVAQQWIEQQARHYILEKITQILREQTQMVIQQYMQHPDRRQAIRDAAEGQE